MALDVYKFKFEYKCKYKCHSRTCRDIRSTSLPFREMPGTRKHVKHKHKHKTSKHNRRHVQAFQELDTGDGKTCATGDDLCEECMDGGDGACRWCSVHEDVCKEFEWDADESDTDSEAEDNDKDDDKDKDNKRHRIEDTDSNDEPSAKRRRVA